MSDRETNKCVYVESLPYHITASDIRQWLQAEGFQFRDVRVVMSTGGRSMGFAFVDTATDEEAQLIIQRFAGAECGGRTLRASVAKSRPRYVVEHEQ